MLRYTRFAIFCDIQTKNGIFGMVKSSLGFFGKKSKNQMAQVYRELTNYGT